MFVDDFEALWATTKGRTDGIVVRLFSFDIAGAVTGKTGRSVEAQVTVSTWKAGVELAVAPSLYKVDAPLLLASCAPVGVVGAGVLALGLVGFEASGTELAGTEESKKGGDGIKVTVSIEQSELSRTVAVCKALVAAIGIYNHQRVFG